MHATVLSLFFLVTTTYGDYYDTKQTGDTNIRFDIQDIVIYGLGDVDYPLGGEDDYSYDYTDMTVKPEAGDKSTTTTTTSKTPETTKGESPSSSTESSSSTSTSTPTASTSAPKTTTVTIKPIIQVENTTTSVVSVNKENATSEAIKRPDLMNSQTFQIPVAIITEGKKGYVSSSSIRRKEDEDTPALPGRKCLQGFYLDGRNRCKPISRKPLHSKEKPRLPNGLRYAQRPTTLEPSP